MNFKQWLVGKFCSYPGASNYYERTLKQVKEKKTSSFDPKRDEPCYRCIGFGGYNTATGYYDYSWHTCSVCDGSGFLNRQLYRAMYNLFKAEEKEKNDEKKRIEVELKYIKSKLTKKELEFLLKHSN